MYHHDTPLCAALGHYVGSLAVVYCPHQQGWRIVWAAGDDENDISVDHGMMEMGPFDDWDEIAAQAASLASSLVRVQSRAWLARRRAQEDGSRLADE